MTLLLFQTIVFQSISQTNYIINNDTIVGYSKSDNRKIAIIFREGERDSSKLKNCEDLNLELINNNRILKKVNEKLNSKISYLLVDNTTLNKGVIQLSDKWNKANSAKRIWSKVALGSITLNILLVLIII